MDPGDQSPYRNSEGAGRNDPLLGRTTSGAIEAHDDDMVMVGADGLQLFETETGMEAADPATARTTAMAETPEAEVYLFKEIFIPGYRTRAHLQTLEQLVAEVLAFHAACGYVLTATSTKADMRAVIMGQNKIVESARLIAWIHHNVVHRHQARMLTASTDLRRSLPELQAVTTAACQILRGCEIQQHSEKTSYNHSLHSDDPSDMIEIVSMTRKGGNEDGGAGTVQMRWTGEPSATGAPSYKVYPIDNQLHHALLVVNFGDLAIDVTIEKTLEQTFMQRLPDLLATLSPSSRVSAVVIQSLYQAIVLHHEASQKHSYRGSAQDYTNEVACYMLNEWIERYQHYQKDADMAEHVVFLDAVFKLAAQIEINFRYEGQIHVLEARGRRG
ncbi:hypothetical protein A1F94_013614 [Pyrenophora tritici-repentis]|uniref:Uncharacterized protein n=1 Tax=Pyrenophora tritici-repentis TaxID=45151 RepID=A0A317AKP3_9PLEO|nr:hypothetical protein PtrV1_05170 [Pyrenophora tritici-repentis]KAF7573892.1 hypothetical protein PtrM4_055150 [Pyrenophora tritici-repentis]KAG9375870.1 hypothetical protein A1F94_013614 [Pyrenophora tritici-repentis]KAI1507684.1 hypothetical protein Ptr86124_013401 [Pyrenophora tritici-repentis]KAI1592041.1 hypothetical protein PtrCC142_011677 [Pyrenophora tritici-repentis]